MAPVKAEKELTGATERGAKELKGHCTEWPGLETAFPTRSPFMCNHMQRVNMLSAPLGTSSFAPSGLTDPWYSCYVLS